MNKGPYRNLHLLDFVYASHSKSSIQPQTTFLLPPHLPIKRNPSRPHLRQPAEFLETLRVFSRYINYYNVMHCFSCILTPCKAGKALLCFNVILIECSATDGSWAVVVLKLRVAHCSESTPNACHDTELTVINPLIYRINPNTGIRY